MIELREMTPEDIPAGNALCRTAGWNQTERDWELFLNFSPHGCYVAIDASNKVVGTVATIKYEDRFAWIGMVLVDPSRKREGIGTKLLHKALSILEDARCIKLDATPAGREVYIKLGFVDEYPLSRLVLNSVNFSEIGRQDPSIIKLSGSDKIFEKDKIVFGASRKELLQRVHSLLPAFSFASTGEDAYCFARQGHHYLHVGPVVAPNVLIAESLVRSSLISTPVVIDVPHHSVEWLRWLASVGFRKEREFTRMFKGNNSYAGEPQRQFAILGPEFG